jgi:Flp pilus assembly protein TadG
MTHVMLRRSRAGAPTRTVRRGRGDEGAVLVEFALLAPVLFLILFGTIEFGWTSLQNLDVRHGAREGARLVAVNYDPNFNSGATQTTDIKNEICNRLDKKTNITVDIELVGSDTNIGGAARVSIHKNPTETLTGFLNWAIPANLNSTVEIRLEQKATWTSNTGMSCT